MYVDTSLTGAKKVDVEAVPTIGGQTLFEIDLDSADKPWRLPGIYTIPLSHDIPGLLSLSPSLPPSPSLLPPGADITDYFNYGFTEETWRLYCEKQRKTKNEVIQLNKIAVSLSFPGDDARFFFFLHSSLSPSRTKFWRQYFRSSLVDTSLFGNINKVTPNISTFNYELHNLVMMSCEVMFVLFLRAGLRFSIPHTSHTDADPIFNVYYK